MSAVTRLLTHLITTRFDGSQAAFADCSPAIDRGLFNRIVSGERTPTPEVIGRLAAKLPRPQGRELIAAYLKDVAQEIRQLEAAARR
jgi:hypothetical protein